MTTKEHQTHDGMDLECEYCAMEREALAVERINDLVALFMIEPMTTWERESAERAI